MKKAPSPLISLLPIVVLVILLFATIRVFGSDALNGGSQISLLTTTAICILIGMAFYKIPWKDYELAITNNVAGVTTAIIILLIIGALSGIWMISGVVPTLIYYGMQIIHPSFFLTSTCIICVLISVMTGSSWTTIATIGIALMGIGKAQGFEEGWIAGAIISGAYFGDKVSPLSETTILAASVTDTPLFRHIRYMMITTVPSLIITLTIFTVAGLSHDASNTQHIAEVAAALNEKFHITPWLLIIPIATGILIARKVPSIITLFLSTLLAGIFALIFQPDLLREISGAAVSNFDSLFKGLMMTIYGKTSLQTDNAVLTDLIATRGMSGMMNTIWLILCAMCFGGAMTASGMLGSITSLFVRFMKKTVSVVSATVCSGLFLNLATADQYISIILTGNMFRDIYAKKGYESCLLSRTTEDSVTVTSVLIPWNTCGMTQATILSVPTLVYLPYCFFNIISPLMSASTMMYAQESNAAIRRADRKAERDAERAKLRAEEQVQDMAAYQQAVQALKNKQFVLEANQVIFRNGMSSFVTSNTNFVLMNGNRATVQTAFNTPYPGPNGIGGVTVDGNSSDMKMNIDKKGNVNCSFSVQGIGISAQVFINMSSGNNNASVSISPNFNNNNLTLNGNIVPLDQSNIFKGRAW